VKLAHIVEDARFVLAIGMAVVFFTIMLLLGSIIRLFDLLDLGTAADVVAIAAEGFYDWGWDAVRKVKP
jgi:hypothetical protein